ncbi:MAG: hypothetical protein IPM92_16880 [Saprospiraceae bacterium]|nr:hypothetical protein [Saprospiraceae bacterium]
MLVSFAEWKLPIHSYFHFLFEYKPLWINQLSIFKRDVVDLSFEKPVLIDFGLPGVVPVKNLAPVLESRNGRSRKMGFG